jgi:hypothetical protein
VVGGRAKPDPRAFLGVEPTHKSGANQASNSHDLHHHHHHHHNYTQVPPLQLPPATEDDAQSEDQPYGRGKVYHRNSISPRAAAGVKTVRDAPVFQLGQQPYSEPTPASAASSQSTSHSPRSRTPPFSPTKVAPESMPPAGVATNRSSPQRDSAHRRRPPGGESSVMLG